MRSFNDVARGSFGVFREAADGEDETRLATLGPADYFGLAKQGGGLEFERAVDMGFGWLLPVSKLLLWLLRNINSRGPVPGPLGKEGR